MMNSKGELGLAKLPRLGLDDCPKKLPLQATKNQLQRSRSWPAPSWGFLVKDPDTGRSSSWNRGSGTRIDRLESKEDCG